MLQVYLIFPSLIQFDIVRFYVFSASVSHVPQQGLFKRPGRRPLCTLDLQPSSCPTCRLGDRRKKSLRLRRGNRIRSRRPCRRRHGGLQAQGLDTEIHQPQHTLDLPILQVRQVQKRSFILQVLEGLLNRWKGYMKWMIMWCRAEYLKGLQGRDNTERRR
jgi:hypothetical protein